MKVLVVAKYKTQFDGVVPFVAEQAVALQEMGCEVHVLAIKGSGASGYLKSLSILRKTIREFNPDIVHAHYGLTGLLCCMQREVPVVVTYHGSDINVKSIRVLSKIAMHLAAYNIFVSERTFSLAGYHKKNAILLPCGINMNEMPIVEKMTARELLGWRKDRRYIVFAGAFNNAVKNAPLAKQAVAMLERDDVELIELKGYSREQVNLLFSAADCLLLTSHTEGSPQVVKEAMAAGCPIVSVDVGDVAERLQGIDGCYIAFDRQPQHIADLLTQALTFEGRTKGREAIINQGLDNGQVAERLVSEVYKWVKNKD